MHRSVRFESSRYCKRVVQKYAIDLLSESDYQKLSKAWSIVSDLLQSYYVRLVQ